MPIRQRFDRLLLGSTILLTAIGLAILASASWLLATERYGRPGSYFFTWQAATAMVGLGLMVVNMHLKTSLLTDRRLVIGSFTAGWILMLAAFAQAPVAATHRWISVGGISLQPSVLVRLALIMLMAILLDEARRRGWPWEKLAVICGISLATAAVIVIQPDLGTAALLAAALGGMAFVAGMPLRLLAAPASVGFAALAVAIITSPYRLARVRAFFDPEFGTSAGWQSYQSLVAIGSGGLIGRGYGSGMQKLFFLPEPHTDFIFAITGEELGLIGMLVLIVLAGVITWRGFVIAARLDNPQRALLAFGITAAFALQSLVHMVVCLDLLPPKGIPLPLVSYGKTEMLVTLVSIGMLLNLSREVKA
ncbi:MAG: putative lipid II flippase FtsW [Acidobacteria bacterium]|jgi:cell division protein FtsW|nr:putative lipid II flippase FtsW [Acidobacteriota bacterium]